jgi:methyl-accepting chemotaxis protein
VSDEKLDKLLDMLRDHSERTDQIARDCQSSSITIARLEVHAEHSAAELKRLSNSLEKLEDEVSAIDKRATRAGAVSGSLTGGASFLAWLWATFGNRS